MMTNDEEDSMSELYQSLSHSKWDCKYHVVFVPKRRRKVIFGQTRRQLGQVFHALARQKECQILERHLMPDHVHMCIAIPPKHPVSSVIGFLKGKSAIAIARPSVTMVSGTKNRYGTVAGARPKPWSFHEKAADRDYRYRFQGSYSGFIRTHNER